MNSIQVILIEDEEQARVQLRSALRSQRGIEVASEATNAVTGLVLLESIDVDVAVVDASLPDMDLLEFLRQMRIVQANSSVVPSEVLILTSPESEQKVRVALTRERVSFCTKDAPINLLAEAVQIAYRGDRADSNELIKANVIYEI